MKVLGIDVGGSSIKGGLVDVSTGQLVGEIAQGRGPQRLTVTGAFELFTVNTKVVPPRIRLAAVDPSAGVPLSVETCQIFSPAETEYT